MSITPWELKRAAAYSVIVGMLVALVVLGDATLARTDSSPATPTATASPVPVQVPPTFRVGIYQDQFGELVQIDAKRITYYAKDNHGNEWIGLGNQRYFRTAGGRLFRTGAK